MPSEDEVDRIVAAWSRERPDFDLGPLQVVSRVRRLSKHIERMRRAAFSATGLEPWEFDVLSALRRAGDPYEMSPKALTEETMVTSGTMTNRIDRLAKRGLVERRSDQTDRRAVIVAMTEQGRRHVDTAMETLLGVEALILSTISKTDQDRLEASLRRLGSGLDID